MGDVSPIPAISWKRAMWLLWMTWLHRAGYSSRDIADLIAESRATMNGKRYSPCHETIRKDLARAENLFFTLPPADTLIRLPLLDPPMGKNLSNWTPQKWRKAWFADYLEDQTKNGRMAAAMKEQIDEREMQRFHSWQDEQRKRQFNGETRLEKELKGTARQISSFAKYQPGLRGLRRRSAN